MIRRKPLTKTAIKKKESDRKRAAKAKIRAVKLRQLEAEALWRKIALYRAGHKCEVCGKEWQPGIFGLHIHHLVKRSQSKRLRLDPRNSLCLCPGHHQYADRDTTWAIAIAEELRPGTAKWLLKERRSTEPKDMDVIEVELESAWLALEVQEWR